MKLISRKIILPILLLVFPTLATSNEVYDIHEFKVHGVSLGDSAEQVIAGLMEYYSISREDLVIEKSGLGRKEPIIAYVDYDREGSRVRTYIQSRIDPKTNLEVVDEPAVLISFRESWNPPKKDYEDDAKEAIEKFGEPTFIFTNAYTRYVWCEKLNADKTDCDDAHASFYIGPRMVFIKNNNL